MHDAYPPRKRSLDFMSAHAEKRAGAPSYTPPSEVAAECVDFLLTEEFHSLDPDVPQEAIVPEIEDGHVFVYLHPGDGAFSPHLPAPATVYEWIVGADGLDDSIPPGSYHNYVVIGNPDFTRRPETLRYLLRACQKRAELVALVLPSIFLRAFTDPDNQLLLELIGHKDVSMEWGRDHLHLSFFVFRRQALIQGPPLPQLPTFTRYESLDKLASSHTRHDIEYQDEMYELWKQYVKESRRREEEEWKRWKK